jgi:hypothetical protein
MGALSVAIVCRGVVGSLEMAIVGITIRIQKILGCDCMDLSVNPSSSNNGVRGAADFMTVLTPST